MQPLLRIGAIALAVAVSAASMPAAQGPAIAGRVTDMSQASMPGVTVTIVPERGGVSRHTTSDRDGGYQFEEVPEDTYRVDFSLLGFEVAEPCARPSRHVQSH
jgi:hypothetical protein